MLSPEDKKWNEEKYNREDYKEFHQQDIFQFPTFEEMVQNMEGLSLCDEENYEEDKRCSYEIWKIPLFERSRYYHWHTYTKPKQLEEERRKIEDERRCKEINDVLMKQHQKHDQFIASLQAKRNNE